MNIVVHADNTGYAPASERYYAIDADTYCGCPDCHCPVGTGATPAAAEAELLELMEDTAP
jgi:hypothetical protein